MLGLDINFVFKPSIYSNKYKERGFVVKSSVNILGTKVKLGKALKVGEVHYGFIRTNKAHIHVQLISGEKIKIKGRTGEVRSARLRLIDKRQKFILEQQIRKIRKE